MNSIIKQIIIVTLFAIAMAAVESAVVVYLRELYYPTGFTLFLNPESLKVLPVELARELATMVMLITVGWLAGTNANTRFAWFLYSFAIWDIFYYVFLKIFINWPMGLFDWDILFIIPIAWLAPVLAPVICSITMILLALLIIIKDSKNKSFKIGYIPISILVIGSITVIASFVWDYVSIIITNGFYKDLVNITQNPKFLVITASFIPKSFNWFVFGIGELIILFSIYKILRKKLTPKYSK
jgi:hypothetical protein